MTGHTSGSRLYKPTLYIGDADKLSELAADMVAERMAARPSGFILGTATGSTPRRLYAKLRERAADGRLKYSKQHTYCVALDEYLGTALYRDEMRGELWEPLGIHGANGIVPFADSADPKEGDVCREFEDQMRRLGAVNLQILGMGRNTHLAFCEPGSPRDGRTSIVRIAESTVEANAVHFGGDLAAVPKLAISKGLGTIRDGEEMFVIVLGPEKADGVHLVFTSNGWNINCPASVLFSHPRVTWFIDGPASARLPKRYVRGATRVG